LWILFVVFILFIFAQYSQHMHINIIYIHIIINSLSRNIYICTRKIAVYRIVSIIHAKHCRQLNIWMPQIVRYQNNSLSMRYICFFLKDRMLSLHSLCYYRFVYNSQQSYFITSTPQRLKRIKEKRLKIFIKQ